MGSGHDTVKHGMCLGTNCSEGSTKWGATFRSSAVVDSYYGNLMNIDLEFARLRTHSVSLSISTADLCCLLILRACEEQSAALPEREVLERLTHVHEQFSETENPRKRATHGLQRLLDQRLLTRVSLGGLTREGEYTLSSLGRGIIEFFVDEARLTRESLLRTLTQQEPASTEWYASIAYRITGWGRAGNLS